MGGVNGHRGLWGFVRGGMGAVSNAIADSARASGAEIRTQAPVEKILVKDGRAIGVVLAGGEEIHAPIVASEISTHGERFCTWWTKPLCLQTSSAASGVSAPRERH